MGSKRYFTLNIEVLDGNVSVAAKDNRISLTVVKVIRLFFRDVTNVVIYICDSVDRRQRARKRKFDSWFLKFDDGSILKEDGCAVVEGMEIYNTLLIHRDNSYRDDILKAFKELNSTDHDK